MSAGDTGTTAWVIALSVLYTSSFVSQLILCVILWDLGIQNPVPLERKSSVTTASTPLEVANFDDDAEFQARIWMMFVRPQLLESAESEPLPPGEMLLGVY